MLKFYYKGDLLFKSRMRKKRDSLDTEYINKVFKMVVKRRQLNACDSHQDYLESLGLKLKRCGFCGDYATTDIVTSVTSEIINKIKVHNINIISIKEKYYYCNNRLGNCEGSKLNPNSVDFVSVTQNLNRKEALKYIKSRNKSPFYKENHKNDKLYKKSQTRDLSFFNKKYGVNGKQRYKNYINKLKYSHSEQYYIDKLGKEEGVKHWEYLSSLKDSMSYNFYITQTDGDILEAKKLYEERLLSVSLTLNGFINRYGEDIGKEKYNYYIKNSRYNTVSKSLIAFFDELVNKLIENNIIENKEETKYGIKNEKAIYNELSGTCYFYDFFIKKHKIIIEYNGIMFHPKSRYDETFKHPFDKTKTTQYFYDRDKHKNDTANKYGYTVLIVWEDDKNKLENCINDINKIINK